MANLQEKFEDTRDYHVKIWVAVDWMNEGHILTWDAERESPNKKSFASIFQLLEWKFSSDAVQEGSLSLNWMNHNRLFPPEQPGIYLFEGVVILSTPENSWITDFKGEWKLILELPERPD